MQVGGANIGRLLQATLLEGGEVQLTPGRALSATVLSVFGDRAILVLGKGVRLEVRLETALVEGEQVRLRVAEAGPEQILLRLEGAPPAEARTDPTPQLVWLPVPLPGGGSGWVQLRIDPEAQSDQGDTKSPAKVSLWWETPGLGPLRADLEASGEALLARFGSAKPDALSRLQAGMAGLTERLTAAGFARVQAGARLLPSPPAPEASTGVTRLDQRG
ncbi:MAG TPA: flagellar hook-length control protein FliK [Symbiobacteriaceae bacterium]|nr:flagellar hook-length control protein FliK [Symbiobacteriaceae bacterium]